MSPESKASVVKQTRKILAAATITAGVGISSVGLAGFAHEGREKVTLFNRAENPSLQEDEKRDLIDKAKNNDEPLFAGIMGIGGITIAAGTIIYIGKVPGINISEDHSKIKYTT